MVSVFKKFLYLLVLVFLVTKVVDFESSEFDPLRAQWKSSFDHVAQHQFYAEYIQPLQTKVGPVVQDIQECYIVPSYVKVNGVAVSQYESHIAKYVALIQQKVLESPIHDTWVKYSASIGELYTALYEHLEITRALSTKYAAKGLIQANLTLKYVLNKSCSGFRSTVEKSSAFYATTKPRVITFYKQSVAPSTVSLVALIQKQSRHIYPETKRQAIVLFNVIKTYYIQSVHPALDKYAFVHARHAYAAYAKAYVDVVIAQATKYYRLFRLKQALEFSKKHVTGSYDQLLKYMASEEAKKSAAAGTEPAIEATTAEEEDFGTAPGTAYEEMGTPEVALTNDIVEAAEETDQAESQPLDDEVHNAEDLEADVEEVVIDGQELETRNTKSNEVTLSLAEEIDAWKTYIAESVDNIFENFDISIADVANTLIDDFSPKLTSLLRNLTETANKDYIIVNKAIYNINSTTALLENGQEVELDQAGKVIDHKITREEFRDLLAEKKESLRISAENINVNLKGFVSDVEVAIENEKKLIVDIYEEFAEVAINEFSKKMMYSTFSSSFENFQNKKDDNSFKDWKEYIKVKNMLVSKRDDLVAKAADTAPVDRLLKEVYGTLKALDHESGNYYAVLRAKANIEFQEREKREREEEAILEEDNEEEVTITSTVIKIQTLNVDGSVHSDEAEVEVIVDEEISDNESDSEDFDAPDLEKEETHFAVVGSAAKVVIDHITEDGGVSEGASGEPGATLEEEPYFAVVGSAGKVVLDHVNRDGPEDVVEHINDSTPEEAVVAGSNEVLEGENIAPLLTDVVEYGEMED